ncbi:MAG TPA: response regulator transcription factor [Mycobacteriales bacterium]|nr:response regulator transcription factor [Mycobacteriales bacterium]
MTIRVLVVDDQSMVCAGLAALLAAQNDIEVVGTAADGAQAVRVASATTPDVVLMDVRMPVQDGVSACRDLLACQWPSQPPRVLMLTTFDVDDYIFEALRAGASGFLLKDAPPAELVSAVRVVASGESLLSPAATRRLVENFVRPRSEPAAVLTEREREILVLVARGLANREIAARLVVAEQTVKTHVSRVFSKLGIRDRAQAVVFAYENGVVSPGEDAQDGSPR